MIITIYLSSSHEKGYTLLMPGPKPHRKRVKHYDYAGEIHELTFSCRHRRPLLDGDWRMEQLSRAIDRAMEKHAWRLAASVFMPEHIHLLTFPAADETKVSPLLFAIKRPYSYRVKQRLLDAGDPLLAELTVQQRPGVMSFRFWQEGPGYDRNIRSEKALLSAIDYIHLNPVRRGLASRAVEYRWSSAKWYESGGEVVDPALPKLTAVPSDWFVGPFEAG